MTEIRRLHGGSINQVIELVTDGQPASIVAKLHTSNHPGTFRREMASLQLYREQTELPVPEPYVCFENDPEFAGSGLLMEYIPARNLADVRLNAAGEKRLQHELALHIAKLHTHHRETFGSALEASGPTRWLDVFVPMLEREYHATRQDLPSRTRDAVDHVIRRVDQYLTNRARPTLVHGDLWSTNILVDDRYPNRPEIKAFIDSNASYADPEYELAYLRVFHTADDTFFDVYRRHHDIHAGFDRRSRVYWLCTMLMHVRIFGDRYIAPMQGVLEQFRKMT